MTLIADGATQTYCLVPRFANYDDGRHACQLKLVGALFHSHALIIHIVHPHLNDTANLTCQILDKSLDIVSGEKTDLFKETLCRYSREEGSTCTCAAVRALSSGWCSCQLEQNLLRPHRQPRLNACH